CPNVPMWLIKLFLYLKQHYFNKKLNLYMKSFFTLFSLVFFLLILQSSTIYAQQNESFLLKENIFYRTAEEAKNDEYIAERCKLDICYPTDKKGFTTIVWFHGGGITGGEKHIPEKLKNQGIAVVTVNYRLNPKVNCPAYIEDAAAAVAWTFNHITEFGGDPANI